VTDRAFDRDTLIEAFQDLGTRAYKLGKVIEISVYGGSALMLTCGWRLSTKAVDAVFEADKTLVRQLAAEIAEERGWDSTWLNDGVKGFISAGDLDPASKVLFGTFPSEDAPGLRVMVAAPEYLFAMKCRAMRIGGVDENSDVDDVRRLALEIGVTTVDEALSLVADFYPHGLLQPKTRFGLEEIFGLFNPDDTTGRPGKEQ